VKISNLYLFFYATGAQAITGDGEAEFPVTDADGNGTVPVTGVGGHSRPSKVHRPFKPWLLTIPEAPRLPAVRGTGHVEFEVTTALGHGLVPIVGMGHVELAAFDAVGVGRTRTAGDGNATFLTDANGLGVGKVKGTGASNTSMLTAEGQGTLDLSRWNKILAEDALLEELLMLEAA